MMQSTAERVPFPSRALARLRHVFEIQDLRPKQVAEEYVSEQRQKIQTGLASLTGLSNVKNVKVYVVDEIPIDVARILDEELDDRVIWVMAHFTALDVTTMVLNSASASLVSESERRRGQDVLDAAARYLTEDIAEAKARAKRTIERMLRESTTDVLGTYSASILRIDIHWLVIWLVSQVLRVRYEDALFVVVAHEFAHAYSHIGCDTDQDSCGSVLFDKMAPEIVEGLAEHYSRELSKQESSRVTGYGGGPLAAYDALLRNASPIYHAYKRWPSYEHEKRHEIIRAATTLSWRRQVTDHDAFVRLLENEAERWGGRRRVGAMERMGLR